MKKLVCVLGLAAFGLPATASAHFNLVAPPPSSAGDDGGKGVPPCGDNPTPGTATPVQGGHALTVMIDETIQHDGFYRFALALNSLSELPVDDVVKDAAGNILPPNGMPKGTSATAVYEDPAVFPVLADNMFPHKAASGTISFHADIMLPNVNCNSCTLQVVEFMAGHDFNTLPSGAPAGGYFYHHCANLKITADPSMPAFTPGAGGASSGGAGSVAGSAGATSLAGGASGAATSGGSGQTSAGGASSSAGAPGSAGASSGGASSSGANAGGASSSSGGAETAGTGVTGSAGATTGTAADNNGCSCSLAQRTRNSGFALSLLGLLALGGLRRSKRARSAHSNPKL